MTAFAFQGCGPSDADDAGANGAGATAGDEDFETIGDVLQALVDGGGKFFDTAAGYSASEEVAGRVAKERGIADQMFWATKVNVAGRGGGSADPAEARAQIERSFDRLRISVIDAINVHNMGVIGRGELAGGAGQRSSGMTSGRTRLPARFPSTSIPSRRSRATLMESPPE